VIPSEQRICSPSEFSVCRLTEAVGPAPGSAIRLREGYRLETYRRRSRRLQIPVLSASVSRERLFDVFLKLLEPLGPEVDVVLESSHDGGPSRGSLRRRHIDRPVLESHFCEYEELLMNDGCTGVAVVATHRPMEVQFDEHKVLLCYARDLRPFRAILDRFGVRRRDRLQLLFDGPHLHFSRADASKQFSRLAWQLGVGAEADMVAG
jgi:hypothetical protein